MALVPDQKFSTFQNGGNLEVNDIIVGLRGGLNTRFVYTGELPIGVIIPISNGGTGADNAVDARTNLGLGTIAVQNANAVAITGGTIAGVAITSSTAALNSGSVTAAPSAGTDLVNKTYADTLFGSGVTSLTGTVNQISFSSATGAVTASLPQNIATTSSPTFAGLTLSSPLTVANGGTGVSSVTTSPTASAFAGWDANSNLRANNFLPNLSSTASSGGTLILTVASAEVQEITGALTHTVQMPTETGLTKGHPFTIINNSSGNVTLNSSGGNLILTMAANTTAYLTCVNNAVTTAAAWNASYIFDLGGGVTSITGTANQVIASSSTGNVTLSTPQNIGTTSSPTFNGITLTSANIGNIGISANTISSTNANGNVLVVPNGTGNVGIGGTPATTTKLDVLFNSSGAATECIRLTNNSAALNTEVQLALQPNTASTRAALITSTQTTLGNYADLKFYTTAAAAPALAMTIATSRLITMTNGLTVSGGSLTLGATQAVNSILTDTTMAAAADTNLYTGLAVKTYISTLLSSWVAYTPTFTGFGTVSNVEIWSRRVGDMLEIRGRFTGGTTTATEARMTLGYNGTNANVNSSGTVITSIQLCGQYALSGTGAANFCTLIESNVGYITFSLQNSGRAGLTKVNGDVALTTGVTMSLYCFVPVTTWP